MYIHFQATRDELEAPYSITDCIDDYQLFCSNGLCVLGSLCDGFRDCVDNSDETVDACTSSTAKKHINHIVAYNPIATSGKFSNVYHAIYTEIKSYFLYISFSFLFKDPCKSEAFTTVFALWTQKSVVVITVDLELFRPIL